MGEISKNNKSTSFAFAITAGEGAEGIQFDYFFDQNIKIGAFYAASKINYFLLVIATALIIKVLFTSLWGVIKRFYMITLYYLAMPVSAATTVPLTGHGSFPLLLSNDPVSFLSAAFSR